MEPTVATREARRRMAARFRWQLTSTPTSGVSRSDAQQQPGCTGARPGRSAADREGQPIRSDPPVARSQGRFQLTAGPTAQQAAQATERAPRNTGRSTIGDVEDGVSFVAIRTLGFLPGQYICRTTVPEPEPEPASSRPIRASRATTLPATSTIPRLPTVSTTAAWPILGAC